MRFGVMLPQSGPLASTQAVVDVAQAAEDLGFDSVSVRDHLSFDGAYTATGMRNVVPEGGDPRRMLECLGTLTFVAARTTTVKLCTSVVILPNRHPLLFAKQTSTLDYLSDGRLRIGIGIGPNRRETAADTTKLSTHRDNLVREYDSFGAYGPRGPRADEYFRALVALWTEDTATFKGEFVHFEDIMMYPKPVQRPYPPVIVGGRSPAARTRAARWGAGWMPSQPTVEEMRAGIEDLAGRRGQFSHPADSVPDTLGINIHSIFADTVDAAVAAAEPTLGSMFVGRDEYVRRTLSGSVNDWIARIGDYRDVGVNYVELKPAVPSVDAFIDQLRVVHDSVMPAFA